ncbi:hypothetical protein Lal_00018783 [Lupinus albus]|nr:hypothetical protein Lal_00018783 [Lupinus albus]
MEKRSFKLHNEFEREKENLTLSLKRGILAQARDSRSSEGFSLKRGILAQAMDSRSSENLTVSTVPKCHFSPKRDNSRSGENPPIQQIVCLRRESKRKKIKSMQEHEDEWKKVGSTIMTDGWTDKRRKAILNFLVQSPKGTIFLRSIDASHIAKTDGRIFKMIDEVVEEIGEDNVVQVVTDIASNYKAAGEMLMEKRKKL